jgi:hypothetical protein
MASKLQYHARAERPIVQMWLYDDDGELIDFSDPLYSFAMRIGNPGSTAVLNKTSGIVGAAGSGVAPTGSGNIQVYWDIAELDIEPGLYAWQLVATHTALDRVFDGTIQILDAID